MANIIMSVDANTISYVFATPYINGVKQTSETQTIWGGSSYTFTGFGTNVNTNYVDVYYVSLGTGSSYPVTCWTGSSYFEMYNSSGTAVDTHVNIRSTDRSVTIKGTGTTKSITITVGTGVSGLYGTPYINGVAGSKTKIGTSYTFTGFPTGAASSNYVLLSDVSYSSGYQDAWYTDASGNKTYVSDDNKIQMYNAARSVTINADVAPVTYTLRYDANGGSGAPGNQTGTSTTGSYTFTISSTRPTRSGYVFQGWGNSASSTTASWQPGDSITVSYPTAKTIYAVWSQTTYNYSLTYYSQGTVVKITSSGSTTASTYTFTVNYTPTRSGYKFKGWSNSSSATTVDYNNGDTITLTGALSTNKNIYAVWKETIPLFYWDAAEGNNDLAIFWDSTNNIGQPITNLTENNWYRFKCKIASVLYKIEGESWTPGHVYDYSAREFNNACYFINRITGHGTLPSNVSENSVIKAKYYVPINSSANLRDALNTAITYYNNN